MESDPSTFKPRGFGQIIGDSFGAYLIDIAKYIVIAAIVIVPVTLCSGALWALGDFARAAADGWSNLGRDLVAILPYAVGTFLLSMLAYPLMQGALIHATEQKRLGQAIGIRHAYHFALGHAGRLIGAWLLTELLLVAMMASLICFPFALFGGDRWLFILTAVLAIGLPFGLFFTVKWLLVLQMVMLEDSPAIQSLTRSSALITRNWWRSLGIWVLLSLVPSFVLAIPFSLMASWIDPGEFGAIVLQGILPAILVVPLSAIAQTILYFDLRARRERYISQITGAGVEVPPAPEPELSPQVPTVQARQPRRLKLKPVLIVVAVAVILVGVITPAAVYLLNRIDAGDIRVSVKRLSTGNKVEIGHGNLKTIQYSDFAFIVDFNASVEAGDGDDAIVVDVKYGEDTWLHRPAYVAVYAQQGSKEAAMNEFFFPEDDPANEVSTTVEILDEEHILISPAAGEFPSGSQLVLWLDYGGGSGWCARMFTR